MLKRTNNLLLKILAVYELLISVPKTQNQQLIEGIHETNQIILQLLAFYPFNNEERLHKSRIT